MASEHNRTPSSSGLIYRARWSFPTRSQSLLETGRIMGSWALRAGAILAPTLEWSSEVVEHADYGFIEEWQASHVVGLVGQRDGERRGRGQSMLAAGGRGRSVGGSGRIRVESLAPYRRLDVDNHCDVTHWDVDIGPVEPSALDALRSSLSEAVGATLIASHERREVVDAHPTLSKTASLDDITIWVTDLEDVGIEVKVDGGTLSAITASVNDFDGIDAALVTLGEVLAEAGETDWEARALDVLRSLATGPRAE